MNKINILILLVFSFSQVTNAQETIIKFKIDGKLTGKDFIAINFDEKGYQISDGIEGELKAEYRRPLLVEFFHIKGNGKILERRDFWVGQGEYTINGSIEDLSTLKIDREHEYNQISAQIKEVEGAVKKELILQNLETEIGVLELVANKSLFTAEEINQAVDLLSEEMRELNFVKRFMAESGLQDDGKIKSGEMSKDFSLESREGGQVSFSDFNGKHRLLEFSFSGCKPCIEALPEIKQIYENFGKSLEVISIWNDRSKDTWLNSSKKHKEMITWTDLWDETGFVTKLYQIDVWPTYMLVAPDGSIEQIWKGYWKGRILRKMENVFAQPN